MVNPCESCQSQDLVSGLSAQINGLVETARHYDDAVWDAAISATNFPVEGLTPAERSKRDQDVARILNVTPNVTSALGEVAETIDSTFSAADAIDCLGTGCDLAKVCPKLGQMATINPQVQAIIKNLHKA